MSFEFEFKIYQKGVLLIFIVFNTSLLSALGVFLDFNLTIIFEQSRAFLSFKNLIQLSYRKQFRFPRRVSVFDFDPPCLTPFISFLVAEIGQLVNIKPLKAILLLKGKVSLRILFITDPTLNYFAY